MANHAVSMLFILGLVVCVLGFITMFATQEQTLWYQATYNYEYPYEETKAHPYQPYGLPTMIIGISLTIVSIVIQAVKHRK